MMLEWKKFWEFVEKSSAIAGIITFISWILTPIIPTDNTFWSIVLILAKPVNVPLGLAYLILPVGIISIAINLFFLNKAKRNRKSALGEWRIKNSELIYDNKLVGRLDAQGFFIIDPHQSQYRPIYGPYKSLQPGQYRAIYRLKITGTPTRPTPDFFYIDICHDTAKEILKNRMISSDELKPEGLFHEFDLNFDLYRSTDLIEFRLIIKNPPNGIEHMIFDKVTVIKLEN